MAPLLFLTAALLAFSGAIEVRVTMRSGLGTPLLPMVEFAGALVVAGLAAAGAGAWGPARWLVPAGVLLVVVSSVRTTLGLRERRRLRELSAARRLETYVKYPSRPPEEKA